MFKGLVDAVSCRCPKPLRRFATEARSNTALEFAIIGPVFFLFIFGIFMISIAQFWQMTLDDAVRNAVRGVADNTITTGPQFVAAVCGEFGAAAPNCNSTTVQYDVQTGTSFAAITPATFNAQGSLSSATEFNVANSVPLQSGTSPAPATPEFLVAQVAYLLPIKIPLIPSGVMTENGTQGLYSSVATAKQY
jgi:Flp pilus assembly protein TadG